MAFDNDWYRETLAADVYRHLLHREKRIPSISFENLITSRRSKLVEWMLYVNKSLFHYQATSTYLSSSSERTPRLFALFSAQTMHLAVYLLDQFFGNYTCELRFDYLVAAVCLSLAVKFEEKDKSLSIQSLQNFLRPFNQGPFTRDAFLNVEQPIMKACGWMLAVPLIPLFTPFYIRASVHEQWTSSFFDAAACISNADRLPCHEERHGDKRDPVLTAFAIAMQATNTDDSYPGNVNVTNDYLPLTPAPDPLPNAEDVIKRMEVVVEQLEVICLKDVAFRQFLPSVGGAACVVVARHYLGLKPIWPSWLHDATGYSTDDLLPCARRLHDTFCDELRCNADLQAALSCLGDVRMPMGSLDVYLGQASPIPAVVLSPTWDRDIYPISVSATTPYAPPLPVTLSLPTPPGLDAALNSVHNDFMNHNHWPDVGYNAGAGVAYNQQQRVVNEQRAIYGNNSVPPSSHAVNATQQAPPLTRNGPVYVPMQRRQMPTQHQPSTYAVVAPVAGPVYVSTARTVYNYPPQTMYQLQQPQQQRTRAVVMLRSMDQLDPVTLISHRAPANTNAVSLLVPWGTYADAQQHNACVQHLQPTTNAIEHSYAAAAGVYGAAGANGGYHYVHQGPTYAKVGQSSAQQHQNGAVSVVGPVLHIPECPMPNNYWNEDAFRQMRSQEQVGYYDALKNRVGAVDATAPGGSTVTVTVGRKRSAGGQDARVCKAKRGKMFLQQQLDMVDLQ